jgi:hypothetical protein
MPRAALIVAQASLGVAPSSINTAAAMVDDRPMPAQQWMTTCRPPVTSAPIAACTTTR